MNALLLGLLVLGANPVSFHELSARAIDGSEVPLSRYKGKVLLVVNTASGCGFTPQYKGLEELYQLYRDRGFEVLAFPSNDFANQEPLSNGEIRSFCELKYKTTFPLFEKSHVKGDDASPVFRYLTGHKNTEGKVSWNFNKFLIDANGIPVDRFASMRDPMSRSVREQIDRLLAAGTAPQAATRADAGVALP